MKPQDSQVSGRSAALDLLARTIDREAHVLLREPGILASHLHNTLVLAHGEPGPADGLLARGREALADRSWARLTNRPSVGRSALIRVLEHGPPMLVERPRRIRIAPALALAWSPDGAALASAGDVRGTVRLWEARTGLLVRDMAVRRDRPSGLPRSRVAPQVTALFWSRDGRFLASGHADGTVRSWDLVTFEQFILRAEAHVEDVAWSPDGDYLASGGWENRVRLWHTGTGLPATAFDTPSRVEAVAWSPDGGRLATGTIRSIQVWTLSGRLDAALDRGSESLAWSPDGAFLASAVGPTWDDHTVRLWNPSSDEMRVLEGHAAGISALAWSPDGSRVASASADGTVRLWGREVGSEPVVLRGHVDWVRAVAWSPDGAVLASGGMDGMVRLWDAAAAREALPATPTHARPVTAVRWSPDGSRLASGSEDGSVRLWDPRTGAGGGTYERSSEHVTTMAWSPDGSRLAWGAMMGPVQVWTPETDEPSLAGIVAQRGGGGVTALAWSPAGDLLASGHAAGAIAFWRPAPSHLGHELALTGTSLITLAYQRSSLSREGFEGFLGMMRPESVLPGHKDSVLDLAWSPDGTTMASASGNTRTESRDDEDCTVRLWDPSGARRTVVLRGHEDAVVRLAWSPDGSRVASGSTDHDVRIWDPSSPRRPVVLTGHTDRVTALAWSPDGGTLASGSADRSVRLWDARTGEARGTLEGHAQGIHALAWSSPGGRLLASGGEDATVRIWEPPRERLVATARCVSPVGALRFGRRGRAVWVADDGTGTGNRPVPYRFELFGYGAG